ncbi:hypothetical protein HYV11_00155 [Candidatus Dependentiae bacterium]|nr:hypothetical protein [Candidatus Dependentiae bacterium]
MDIIGFLNQLPEVMKDDSLSVIGFYSKIDQPIFFSQLKQFIEEQYSIHFQKISFSSMVDIEQQLSTSFLGQRCWYWFSTITMVDHKKEEFIRFIKNYQGPHRLFVCVNEESFNGMLEKGKAYSIHHSYTSDQIKKISMFYNQNPELIAHFFHKLFLLKNEYSLDQLSLLKEYALLLGKSIDSFLDLWVEQLIVTDISLFSMGQLFFSKNKKEFFKKWQTIRPFFVDQFWTAFFSEQIFKAYFYVLNRGVVPASQKQLTFGLPFSFLKHDWKLYKSGELQRAHQRMYEIDLLLKKDASVYVLDHFHLSFFNNFFV